MSVNPRQQSNKSQPPLLKNAAAAPFVYFDLVPAFGVVNGVVELELAAQMVVPTADGNAHAETVCTVHLRGSIAAMEGLSNAIDKAMDMVRAAAAPSNGAWREPPDYPDAPIKN
jgi:hypothetical protein